MPRKPSPKEFAHEKLGAAFEQALSTYDTRRRIETLIDEFLPESAVVRKTALDVGCGLGYFSERLVQRGARVTGCDLGANLVDRTRSRAGCHAQVVDALELVETFGREQFDVVVSSECVEHTPNPDEAVRQMLGVLRPGGYLSISTPNIVWSPVVRLATAVGARPFDGLENFSSWQSLRRVIQENGGSIVQERGLHLFPFQLPLRRLSTWCDHRLQMFRFAMINICILARKS